MFLKLRFTRPREQFSFSHERDFQLNTVMLARAAAVEGLYKPIDLLMTCIVREAREMFGDPISDPLQNPVRIFGVRKLGSEANAKPEGDRPNREGTVQ
jgi:hypothetical protein